MIFIYINMSNLCSLIPGCSLFFLLKNIFYCFWGFFVENLLISSLAFHNPQFSWARSSLRSVFTPTGFYFCICCFSAARWAQPVCWELSSVVLSLRIRSHCCFCSLKQIWSSYPFFLIANHVIYSFFLSVHFHTLLRIIVNGHSRFLEPFVVLSGCERCVLLWPGLSVLSECSPEGSPSLLSRYAEMPRYSDANTSVVKTIQMCDC